MSIKSQGTELFFVNPDTGVVTKMSCPTGITGLGGAADQVEITCLDSVDKQYSRGLGNSGQVTVPFIMDPTAASHQVLFGLQAAGDTFQWMICLSDGTGTPTANSLDQFNALTTRSNVTFDGYISDVTIDVAGNDAVRGTLIIQRSGSLDWYWAS